MFYNRGHIGPAIRQAEDAFTHFELESLPSGQWGYMHFPCTVRFARTLGKEYPAQTGKFHTMWGDFGSYKNPAALEFECFQMLALGARCLIGDQLEPGGRLTPAVYRLVGDVYEQVEAAEPWRRGGAARVRLTGTYRFHRSCEHCRLDAARVLVRVMSETDNRPVVP